MKHIRILTYLIIAAVAVSLAIWHKVKIAQSDTHIPQSRDFVVLDRADTLYPDSAVLAVSATFSPEMTVSDIRDMIIVKSLKNDLNPIIMVQLASCESGLRQFAENGSVLSGRVHPPDKGIFQINIKVWDESSKLTGYDWRTTEGNIDLAMWIAKNYGYKQWVCFR